MKLPPLSTQKQSSKKKKDLSRKRTDVSSKEDEADFSYRIRELKLYKLFTPESKRKVSEVVILDSVEDFNPLNDSLRINSAPLASQSKKILSFN